MPNRNSFLKLFSHVVFFGCAALLSAAYFYLRPEVLKKIHSSEQQMLHKNLTTVLPSFDNEPWNESFKVDGVKIYPARREEKISLSGDSTGLPGHEFQTVTANVLKGFAFQISAADGEGSNPVWIALDLEGELAGFCPSYLRQARVPENFTGNISPGTPASRTITDAVNRGKEFFEMHKNFFLAQAHQAQAWEMP